VGSVLLRRSLRVPDASSGWIGGEHVGREFQGLVERLSEEAALHPNAYRRRVIFAGLLGYAFIGIVLVMLLAIVGASIAALSVAGSGAALQLKIAFVAGLVAFVLFRAMIVGKYVPEGTLVTPAEAPELFGMISHVQRKVGGRRIDEVYITDEMNASIAQPSRFGIFGVRNILSLGLPLMHSLSRAELMAVIAHELGHSVGAHGQWAAWVYRVRCAGCSSQSNFRPESWPAC
jgi:Zn-dependent protease with chaperone function